MYNLYDPCYENSTSKFYNKFELNPHLSGAQECIDSTIETAYLNVK